MEPARDTQNSELAFFTEVESVSSNPEPPENGLNYMLNLLLVTALEDAIMSSTILDNCSNMVSVARAKAMRGRLLAKKFGAGEGKQLEDEIRYPLDCTENKLAKMTADKALLDKTFQCLIAELYNKKSWRYLQKSCEHLNRFHLRLDQLTTEMAALKLRRHELRRNLIHLRNSFRNMVYASDGVIENLISTINDNDTINHCKRRYIQKWQGSRIEQYKFIVNTAQNQNIDSISKYKTKVDHETRVHDEVDLFNRICIGDLQLQIDDIMDKYDEHEQDIDLKIQKKRILYNEALERRTYLQQTLAKHTQELKKWTNFKMARKKERDYEEKKLKSVVIVQAWWRGLMVRLQLGPYKPKKVKKGGKKKGKKAH